MLALLTTWLAAGRVTVSILRVALYAALVLAIEQAFAGVLGMVGAGDFANCLNRCLLDGERATA